MTFQGTVAIVAPEEAVGQADLEVRYQQYRRRHAARLLRLMPRDAVRPLFRRAADHARSSGIEQGTDPLAFLVTYCESILPLPPFGVWAQDLRHNPDAYLADLGEDASEAQSVEAPSTLEVRSVPFAGSSWRAHLRTFRDGPVWRGFIAFEDEAGESRHRTAPVFCEEDPTHLRERFRSFDPTALAAFLRSALP